MADNSQQELNEDTNSLSNASTNSSTSNKSDQDRQIDHLDNNVITKQDLISIKQTTLNSENLTIFKKNCEYIDTLMGFIANLYSKQENPIKHILFGNAISNISLDTKIEIPSSLFNQDFIKKNQNIQEIIKDNKSNKDNRYTIYQIIKIANELCADQNINGTQLCEYLKQIIQPIKEKQSRRSKISDLVSYISFGVGGVSSVISFLSLTKIVSMAPVISYIMYAISCAFLLYSAINKVLTCKAINDINNDKRLSECKNYIMHLENGKEVGMYANINNKTAHDANQNLNKKVDNLVEKINKNDKIEPTLKDKQLKKNDKLEIKQEIDINLKNEGAEKKNNSAFKNNNSLFKKNIFSAEKKEDNKKEALNQYLGENKEGALVGQGGGEAPGDQGAGGSNKYNPNLGSEEKGAEVEDEYSEGEEGSQLSHKRLKRQGAANLTIQGQNYPMYNQSIINKEEIKERSEQKAYQEKDLAMANRVAKVDLDSKNRVMNANK